MKRKSRLSRLNKEITVIGKAQFIIGLLVFCCICYTMITGVHFKSQENILAFKEQSQIKLENIQAVRGHIYDRNEEVIAQDIDTYTIYVILDESRLGIGNVPAYVVDKQLTAEALAPILDCDPQNLLDYMNKDVYQTYFGFYGKGLTSRQKEEIEALELPGIEFERNIDRVYPTGLFASHLIGFAQYDPEYQRIVGKMGVEALMDDYLEGQNGVLRSIKDASNHSLPGTSVYELEPVDGHDIYLTLDKSVQVALETALKDTIKHLDATKAWGIVMEVETGKILGWASNPSFDLNIREIDNYLNFPSEYVFEPGSTMKPITYAAAIDTGNYDSSALVQTGAFHVGLDANTNPIRLSGPTGIGTINDANDKGWGIISFDEGLIRSSNTTIAQLLTDYLPLDTFEEYLDRFKLFEKMDVTGIQSSVGVKNYTYPFDKLAAGFGQGSSTTALNLMQAYTAIFNDGRMMKPYFIDKVVDSNGEIVEQYESEVVGQPIKESTAQQVLALMESVVDKPYGTSHLYRLNDTTMAAKTGTGEVAVDGSYTNLYISSVIAGAPADDPKVMMFYGFENKNPQRLSGDYFRSVMNQALFALDAAGGKEQEEVSQRFTMPSLTGSNLGSALAELDTYSAEVEIIGDGEKVVAQFPTEGSDVASNQKVFLLSEGSQIIMPDMKGWNKKDLTTFWRLSGISVVMDGYGLVSEQSIEAGEVIDKSMQIVVQLAE